MINCKALSLWVCFILILWIMLLYMVNMNIIDNMRGDVIEKFTLSCPPGFTGPYDCSKQLNTHKNIYEQKHKQDLKEKEEEHIQTIDDMRDKRTLKRKLQDNNDYYAGELSDKNNYYRGEMNRLGEEYDKELEAQQSNFDTRLENVLKQYVPRSHFDATHIEESQKYLKDNYNKINDLDQDIDTKERELNLLNDTANDLNRVAYIIKYVTIISISMLILMICVFVLKTDVLSSQGVLAKRGLREFVRKATSVKTKSII